MEEKYIKIIGNIINHYTKEQQVIQAIEEMSELTKELTKNINRGKDNKEEIKDEISDNFIMLAQLIMIYQIDPEEIIKIMKMKLDRQLRRMENE